MQHPDLPIIPQKETWYRVTVPGALSSDGSDWRGYVKLGCENKVIVYFCGGGVSVNAYMAAYENFYFPRLFATDMEYTAQLDAGIGSREAGNPFAGWSVVILPYTTGDFHVGQGEFAYTDANGAEKILHHRGYINYTGCMERVAPHLGTPEMLLVCGSSAGAFGAALLCDDLIENYFPQTQNVTMLPDSGLMLYRDWRGAAENVWHAPVHISKNLLSEDIVCDALTALHEKYGARVKIAVECSVRDAVLAMFQNYFTNDQKIMDRAAGDYFQKILKKSCLEMIEKCAAGVLVWDGLPRDNADQSLTRHCIINSTLCWEHKCPCGLSIAEWAMNAVNGKVESFGLELFDKQY